MTTFYTRVEEGKALATNIPMSTEANLGGGSDSSGSNSSEDEPSTDSTADEGATSTSTSSPSSSPPSSSSTECLSAWKGDSPSTTHGSFPTLEELMTSLQRDRSIHLIQEQQRAVEEGQVKIPTMKLGEVAKFYSDRDDYEEKHGTGLFSTTSRASTKKKMSMQLPVDPLAMSISPERILESSAKHVKKGNMLKEYMIQNLALRRSMLLALSASGKIPEVDTAECYERFGKWRSPPPIPRFKNVSEVGFELIRDPDGHPSYLSFFIPGWGAWFPCVHEKAEKSQLDIIKYLLDKISWDERITLVCFSKESSEYFQKTFPRKEDFHPPKVIVVGEGEIRGLEEFAWMELGVDIISWQIRADICRLYEASPKNPIDYSFLPPWKIRSEQMARLVILPMVALALYQTRSKTKASTKCM